MRCMAIRLGIIGGGNMGSAIARGAIRARMLAPEDLLVAEQNTERHEMLRDLGCGLTTDPRDAFEADEVLIAVKPQHFAPLAENLVSSAPDRIVISIMAGLESPQIRAALGGRARIIRVMPNTPCQLGEGMTGIALGAGAVPGDERLTRELFEALGRTAMVEESLMHAVTAVSGSGPAYVYLLAELMEKAAQETGLDAATSQLLVIQTIIGAGRMLRESGMEPAALRQVVTTPGGTTAAAVDVFLERDLAGTLIEAITAARDRGRTLGK